MPTQVETMPTRTEPAHPHHAEKHGVHDPLHPNNHWVHNDALRVAIGSILTPKRTPFSPGSRSASGSASPYSFPASTSHTPGTGTPVHHADHSGHLYPHLLPGYHHHPHPHTPSRLARTSSQSPPGGGSPTRSSPTSTKPPADLPVREAKQIPPVPTIQVQNENNVVCEPLKTATSDTIVQANRPGVSPLQPTAGGNGKTTSMPAGLPKVPVAEHEHASSGRGTPRAKFIEKLQSKSAWDALIHGSFS